MTQRSFKATMSVCNRGSWKFNLRTAWAYVNVGLYLADQTMQSSLKAFLCLAFYKLFRSVIDLRHPDVVMILSKFTPFAAPWLLEAALVECGVNLSILIPELGKMEFSQWHNVSSDISLRPWCSEWVSQAFDALASCVWHIVLNM